MTNEPHYNDQVQRHLRLAADYKKEGEIRFSSINYWKVTVGIEPEERDRETRFSALTVSATQGYEGPPRFGIAGSAIKKDGSMGYFDRGTNVPRSELVEHYPKTWARLLVEAERLAQAIATDSARAGAQVRSAFTDEVKKKPLSRSAVRQGIGPKTARPSRRAS